MPLKTVKETEKLNGGGATTGGAAGTGANIPTYSAGSAAGGSNSNYSRSSGTTDWGVDKKVDHTEVAPGAINKLHVALLVDKSVSPADFAAIQKAVSSAAGIDTTRGDVMQAAQVPFAKVAAPKTGPVPTSMLGPLKWVGARPRHAALPLLHDPRATQARGRGARRPVVADRDRGARLAGSARAADAGHERAAAPHDQLPPRAPDTNLQAIDQLMEREPERVAAQVKQWMAED